MNKRTQVDRVLMIAPACDGEDVGEAWLAAQWAQLLSEKYQLTLLTTHKRGHTSMTEQLPTARVIDWPEPRGVDRFERLNSLMQPGYLPFYRRARRWIRDRMKAGESFDIAHQVVPVAMRYPSPAAGLGIPLVIGPVGGSLESPSRFVHEEGATPWYQRLRALDGIRLRHDPVLRKTYESADVVVGVADYVRDRLAGLDIARVEIMSDVAVERIHDSISRPAHGGPVRLLHVGRTVRTKGLRDLIRAMSRLRDLDVVLDVLGDGNDRDACEKLIVELDLADRIALHGRVSRSVVDEFYKNADVFVFPSYREPGGTVVLEAMSWGLPAIVCRRGGPGANVDETCAILLDAISPAQLASDCADAIRTMVTHPDLRLRMGAAGRERVLRTHMWPQRVERMSRLYEEVRAQRA